MTKSQLFQDIFEINDIDPHGKKFDRVSRIIASSENIDMAVTLDVNIEIYPLKAGEKFTLALASTLALDGASVDTSKKQPWRDQANQKSLADEYDYVMYGKVYKYDDTANAKVSVYASFGGLLMCLTGDYRQLQSLTASPNNTGDTSSPEFCTLMNNSAVAAGELYPDAGEYAAGTEYEPSVYASYEEEQQQQQPARMLTDEELEMEMARINDLLASEEGNLQRQYDEARTAFDHAQQQQDVIEVQVEEIRKNYVEVLASIDEYASQQFDKEQEQMHANFSFEFANAQIQELTEQQDMLLNNLEDLDAYSATDAQLADAIKLHEEHLGKFIVEYETEVVQTEKEAAENDIKGAMLMDSLKEAEEQRTLLAGQLMDMEPAVMESEKLLAIERGKLQSLEAEDESLGKYERNLVVTRGLIMAGAAIGGVVLGALSFGIAGGLALGVGTITSVFLTTMSDSARSMRADIQAEINKTRIELARLEAEHGELQMELSAIERQYEQSKRSAENTRVEVKEFLQQTGNTRRDFSTRTSRLELLRRIHASMVSNASAPRTVLSQMRDMLKEAKETKRNWEERRKQDEVKARSLRQDVRDISMKLNNFEIRRRQLEKDKSLKSAELLSHSNNYGKRSQAAINKELQIKAFKRVVTELRVTMNSLYKDLKNKVVKKKTVSKSKQMQATR
ncbi:DNA-directed RNA polymerases I, II, and III subunit RPABC3 [Polyrhizophydium stewartii]|uniref:DNA-directed RNA polymerases I, II, and III subunit RPABC3 n=1 Tax=Polyrhizophydium stewartii TaxID=2732419 RepID=A0ABR4NA74_9FUNG